MLTRLQVNGFKNLRSVDVRFGPFTCIVGYNAAGKSNLFDSITFLSLLADKPFGEAAELVRGTENERTADPQDLFWNGSDSDKPPRIHIAAEMVVAPLVEDDLGQTKKVSITFLRYEIELGYEVAGTGTRSGRIVLISEKLSHITQGDAAKHLLFDHSIEFRRQVVTGRRAGKEFISMEGTTVQVHQDGGSRGKPLPASTTRASTSVLSTVRTVDSPTILAARREMQQWRRIALEPSAMRSADHFRASSAVDPDGRHVPAALYRIAHRSLAHDTVSPEKTENTLVTVSGAASQVVDPEEVYARVASRLNDFAGLRVSRLWVEEDPVRELLTLRVQERSGVSVPARSLSEGTLRFLALCTMLEDEAVRGLLCMEEPENGLHPENVPAMIDLLKDLAVDAKRVTGSDNPFRQVIVNTHSPAVVDLVDPDELLIARPRTDETGTSVNFFALKDTWRALANPSIAVGRGVLAPYAGVPRGQLRLFELPEAG